MEINIDEIREDAELLQKQLNEPDKKEDSFDIILTHFSSEDIILNEISLYFNQDGKQLTERDLNYEFIKLKQDNPKSKGLTKSNFDIALNSTFIQSVNPLKQFFSNVKNNKETGLISTLVDSIDIIPNVEIEKSISNTKQIVKQLFTKWLIGVVASVYDNNYNCLMIVLIGPKGCGKTEFFRRLLPEELMPYFAQSKLADGKDSEAIMCEKLVILNDELDGLHSKEAKTFRNFISANTYTHRPPYGKQNITRKRLASVCGASNDKNVIIDAENNRRIIPIEIRSVNHQIYNSVCKKSLFAEAYQLYKSGMSWNLSKEEMIYLDCLSENYETPCIEYELIQKSFTPINGLIEMTASEIKSEIEKNTHQKLSIHKIGANLKRLGFQSKMIKRNGKSAQVYSVSAC
jgi:predicted P-loop ATPase